MSNTMIPRPRRKVSRANVTFVYCPRSGPRWIEGAEPRAGIRAPVVVWHNGSAHVVGRVVRVDAASPRKWWRDLATEVAKTIAALVGGVAWDENGFINVAVPQEAGRSALLMFWAADPFDAHPLGKACRADYADGRALIQAGGAEAAQILAPAWLPDMRGGGPDWRYATEARGARSVVRFWRVDDGLTATVAAPWALVEVYGADPA